ncbi:MAG TPA: DNA-directed RNA polymerase subunit beta [Armatimonadota bacterium]
MATKPRTEDGLNAAFSPVVPIPNLIEIQLASFQWFLEDGLRGLFRNFSPIKDFTETLELELVDYHLEQPKYSQDECRQRDMTYEAPIKVQVRLHSREDGVLKDVVESEVYMGALPLMTEQGTFIINGAERVVVSQLARSPGVYFRDNIDYSGRTLYYATVIPSEGAWTDVETETSDVITVRVGQTKKFPITTLLRALNFMQDPKLTSISEIPWKSAEGLPAAVGMADPVSGEVIVERGAIITPEAIKKAKKANLGPNVMVHELPFKATTDAEIMELFGTRVVIEQPKAEDIVGKLPIADLKGIDGKVVAHAYKRIEQKQANDIIAGEPEQLELLDVSRYVTATLEADPTKDENTALLDIYKKIRPGDPATLESARNLLRSVYYDVRRYDLARVGRFKLNRKLGVNVDIGNVALTRTDIIAIIRYIIRLADGDTTASVDDIDHLANKRVRSVGELLQNQLRLGFLRMEKVARERMTSVDADHAIPQVILSVKPISASIKSFFGSSQLSQFMDQHNPLAELTHKRRLSALGPGGLSRQSAKLEVRDVHHSHYGRICPIETPEGPNIGLIGSMAVYTHINEFGFLEAPYYVVKDGVVTEEVVYLTADSEEAFNIVPSGTPLKDNGDGTHAFLSDMVQVRHHGRFPTLDPSEVHLMDISPMQVFSPATSLIPFLENDDANRALMGSNMQRQAVPVIKTDAPIVGTGLETRVAVDSGAVIIAKRAGKIKSVTSERIKVEVLAAKAVTAGPHPLSELLGQSLLTDLVDPETGEVFYTPADGEITPKTVESAPEGFIVDVPAPGLDAIYEIDEYRLENMRRSNQATCIRQVAIVKTDQRVRVGQPMADGPCTDQGRLALGQNLLVAFMTWGGYNYEDAIILSQRIVKEDIFSSIHIEKYEVEARDTKLGPEEITRDIPNVSEDSLKDLDEYGIIRIGADVGPEDILVGKVAPKSQGEQSAEERLIIAIFGKKAEETRDVSLRVPHGEKGKIIDVKVFSRFKYECERCKAIFDYSKKPDRLLCDRCGGDLERLPGDELPAGVNQLVRVYIAQKRKIMEGDKMAGRHGNKGVISRICPIEEMPFMPDGTPVDIVLNPLGVPSRMNIGQVMETHLGLVGRVLGKTYDEHIFRGDKEHEILDEIRTLVDHFRNRRLREYANDELSLNIAADETTPVAEVLSQILEALKGLSPEDSDALATQLGVGGRIPSGDLVEKTADGTIIRLSPSIVTDLETPITAEDILARIKANVYERVGLNPDTGKCQLISGQTGEPYECETMVGQIYMLKLLHLVEDKIHARSTGPYSLVTQQPLGGKAQFGGQRFGEMEVWALEAYGAAYTLQEILTIKSDDVLGRVKTYESIVKGDQIMEPGVPESFKILVNELQSLCLKVTVEDAADREIDLRLQEDEQLEAAERAGAPRLAQSRYGGDL